MATEPKTGLTYWPSGAIQQDLLFNAKVKFDAVAGYRATVIDKDLATPPGSPASGAAYIVAATPTGAWSGKAGSVAYWNDLAWEFFTPNSAARWVLFVVDEGVDYRWTGSAWALAGSFVGGALSAAIDEAKFANIASAATTNIGGAAGNFGHITGTTTIAALGTAQAGARRVTVFDGILTLTHHATSMILLTGANITTAAGDIAVWESEGSGNWRMVGYERKDGTPLVGAAVITVNGDAGAVIVAVPIIGACSDEGTALTTGSAKLTFRMPYAFTVTGVRASLTTAQATGSILTVDINENGSSILSTKLTIDNTEKTSTTAAAAAVIGDASLADDAEITVDIDQVGDGTAKGLKIMLIGYAS